MAFLAVYIYISLYGIFNTKAELQPTKLFLKTSDVLEILHLRNEFVMPFYAVCMVFVNNPGNLSNPLTVQKWNNLVSDFEELPSSLGKFSTKYWMRDYQEFVQNAEEAARLVSEEVEDLELEGRKKNELRQFFEWPEFQHWHGFVSIKDDAK
uniref:Uncharacterized protein n=1 Tax=Panagrolaimus sp. ES5 TaxID=591445 RepID=A0AC34GHB4_9BILA